MLAPTPDAAAIAAAAAAAAAVLRPLAAAVAIPAELPAPATPAPVLHDQEYATTESVVPSLHTTQVRYIVEAVRPVAAVVNPNAPLVPGAASLPLATAGEP